MLIRTFLILNNFYKLLIYCLTSGEGGGERKTWQLSSICIILAEGVAGDTSFCTPKVDKKNSYLFQRLLYEEKNLYFIFLG